MPLDDRPSDVHRADVRRIAAEAVSTGDDTGWFEPLYAAADRGEATVPWADLAANPMLVGNAPSGDGTALVIGCGYGDDAAYLASLGWRVTAFDISPTAVETARRRFPDSGVDFVVADLLEPPPWRFDLVVEIYTVQTLIGAARDLAITGVAEAVAPGGELLVIARDNPGDEARLWDLTEGEIDSFARGGLVSVEVERFHDFEEPPVPRWRVRFRRP